MQIYLIWCSKIKHCFSAAIHEAMSATQINSVNVYCPECPPGGTIGHPGRQQKMFLPFGHGRDLVAFNSTGLQNKSFQDRAEISKA